MERVLKRVGLSKRTQPEPKTHSANEPEERAKVRRRRRSKSRRRSSKETKKPRGLFNIDWESVKECKSCKSRAITRKFCSKRCDNELYRSNSFKFERFVRGNDEISTLGKKVSYIAIFRILEYKHKWSMRYLNTSWPLLLLYYWYEILTTQFLVIITAEKIKPNIQGAGNPLHGNLIRGCRVNAGHMKITQHFN